jgi:hypothetical protein
MSRRLLLVTAVAAAIAIALLVRARPPSSKGTSGQVSFTRVGQSGAVFTVTVPRDRANDDEYLMRVAELLSAEDRQVGGSGQISVMVWPDGVPVPREPPSTEFDPSMKTQVAGIFINPARNIKHVIRFRDGETIAERDFGTPTR